MLQFTLPVGASATRSEDVEKIITVITEAAKTGNIGDGKIFVSSIEKIIRIRTGEQDEEAI